MSNDLEKIKQIDERDIAASLEQDYASLIKLWDDEGVAIPPGEDPIVGIEAIKAWLNQSGDTEYEITKYEHDFKERKIMGDWAFEWGTYESAAKPLNGGDPFGSSGKLLRILKRQPDGEWKVARAIWNIDPRG